MKRRLTDNQRWTWYLSLLVVLAGFCILQVAGIVHAQEASPVPEVHVVVQPTPVTVNVPSNPIPSNPWPFNGSFGWILVIFVGVVLLLVVASFGFRGPSPTTVIHSHDDDHI